MALNRKVARKSPSPKEPLQLKVERSAERLINYNGTLVEGLLKSEAWAEIGQVLLDEMVASVTGRKTGNRYYHGSLSKGTLPLEYCRGYAQFGMDFSNRLQDFIVAKENLTKKKRREEKEAKQPMINPFLEEIDGKENSDWPA